MVRIIRFDGKTALLILGVAVIFFIAAVYLAFRIVLWLLPVIIVGVAAWIIVFVFNRPPKRKQGHIDVDYKIKD